MKCFLFPRRHLFTDKSASARRHDDHPQGFFHINGPKKRTHVCAWRSQENMLASLLPMRVYRGDQAGLWVFSRTSRFMIRDFRNPVYLRWWKVGPHSSPRSLHLHHPLIIIIAITSAVKRTELFWKRKHIIWSKDDITFSEAWNETSIADRHLSNTFVMIEFGRIIFLSLSLSLSFPMSVQDSR